MMRSTWVWNRRNCCVRGFILEWYEKMMSCLSPSHRMGVVNIAEVACVDQVYDRCTQVLYDDPIASMYYYVPILSPPLASKLVGGFLFNPRWSFLFGQALRPARAAAGEMGFSFENWHVPRWDGEGGDQRDRCYLEGALQGHGSGALVIWWQRLVVYIYSLSISLSLGCAPGFYFLAGVTHSSASARIVPPEVRYVFNRISHPQIARS